MINSSDDANKFNITSAGGYFRLQNAKGNDIVTVGQSGGDMYVPDIWTGRITANASIITKGASGGFYMPSRNGTGEEFSWYNQDGTKAMLWNKVGGNVLTVDVSGNTNVNGKLNVTGSNPAPKTFAFGQPSTINAQIGGFNIGSNNSGFDIIQGSGTANQILIGSQTDNGTVQIWNNQLIVDRNITNNGGNLVINNARANFLTLNDGTSLTNTSVRVWRDNASCLIFVGQNDANTDYSWPGVKLNCKSSVVTANNFISLSDQRLKTNIEPLRNVISSIKQINGVKFNYKTSPNKKSIGLIAQEVEKVFPELVSTDDTADKMKSVSYSNMVGVLVEAVKEQQKMIEELQATVKMLVSRLG